MNPDKKTVDHSQYRYWTRIAKGCALPLLYTFVSILMLRNYVLEFPDFFEYDMLFIMMGAGLGVLTMTGMTVLNIVRARKKPANGVKLENWTIVMVYIPILIIMMVIALFLGLATVWQFSIGFFATAIVPPLLVIVLEQIYKGQFIVREFEKPSRSRRLVLIPTTTG